MGKFALTFLFLFTAGVNANTIEALPENVVLEQRVDVAFAPPEIRGTYRFQVHADGSVVKIDNKENSTLLALLSEDVVGKLQTGIDAIEDTTLTEPSGRPCTDVPTKKLKAQTSEKATVLLWKRFRCLDHAPTDKKAIEILSIANNLENLFFQINRLVAE